MTFIQGTAKGAKRVHVAYEGDDIDHNVTACNTPMHTFETVNPEEVFHEHLCRLCAPLVEQGECADDEHGIETLDEIDWELVEAPTPWRPRRVGAELVGYYGGKTQREGEYGTFYEVIVHVPHRGAFVASGSQLLRALDAAQVQLRQPVRIVWGGMKVWGEEDDGTPKTVKLWSVYVERGSCQ